MKTGVNVLVVVGLVCGLSTLGWAQDGNKGEQRAEKRAEKIGEIKAKRDAKFDEHMAQWQKRHDEFIAKLTERLANCKRLTADERTGIVDFFEQQYKENVSFREGQHEENMKFLDTLVDPTLTHAQIREKIKAFMATQKGENQEHRAQQKDERQAERDKIKAEKKD